MTVANLPEYAIASFPEYAIKYAESARKTRLALSPQLRQTVDEIEADLAWNPDKYPERLTPVSIDGKSQIYRQPVLELQITFGIDREQKILYFFHYFAPKLTPQPTVFISYSHEDRPWLEKLKTFLTDLEQRGIIKFWDDKSEHGLR